MPHTIAKMVRTWSRKYKFTTSNINIDKATTEEIDKLLEAAENDYPSKYEQIESQIDFLTSKLYHEYEITKYPPYKSYRFRLRDWLNNVENEADRKTLFELAPRIFFLGQNEYLSLYHSSFNGPIARWLIDQENIDITHDDAQSFLQSAIPSTWFCAITDSMQIARFYHVNQLEGVDLRPDFRILTRFANKTRVVDYMNKNNPPLKRIVLLEDFVATGSQMEKAVRFASTLQTSSPIPILLCPLVICKSGYKKAKNLVREFHNLSFEPSLILDDSVVLPISSTENEDEFFDRLRALVISSYDAVAGDKSKSNKKSPYGPFGFGAHVEQGGLILVLYTNCPDNTLPLIHHGSDTSWCPLFPRSSRV